MWQQRRLYIRSNGEHYMFRILLTTILSCLLLTRTEAQTLNKEQLANTRQRTSDPRPMVPAVRNKHVVIAHRGDHTAFPENTLAAYRSAIGSGVDYVEVDLRTSKDSVLVILHNESVDRMTNGHGNIRDLDSASIRSLEVKSPDGQPDRNPNGAGRSPDGQPGRNPDGQPGRNRKGNMTGGVEHIPTFREVLALCKGRINIYLDFKEAAPRTTWDMIRAAHMERHVIVYANTEAQLWEWVKIAPEVPLITSVPDEVKDVAGLNAFLDKYPVSALDGSLDQYSQEMLKLLKQRRIAVWLDVQSKEEGPQRWQKALDQQVEGMQTDHPGDLVRWLKTQGKR